MNPPQADHHGSGLPLSEMQALPSGAESSRKPDFLWYFFDRLPAATLPEASSGQAGQAGKVGSRKVLFLLFVARAGTDRSFESKGSEHSRLKCIAIYI